MKLINRIMSIAMMVAMGASAAVYHEVDFDTVTETLNNVNSSNWKIRFGGMPAPAESVSTNEWAGFVGNPATTAGRVNIVDDGTGTNNVFHLNGVATKTISTALVVAPEKLGGTASVARVSFDLTLFDKKGAGDASDGYLKIYEASGYDLSGATSNRIIIQCAGQPSGGSFIAAQYGATLTLLDTKQFSVSDVGTTVSLDFAYDGSSAIIALWESWNKSQFKFDNVRFTDEGVQVTAGDSSVVFFGGNGGLFAGDPTTNNLFVGQTDAGEIVQWNGADSDGGSVGASGTLVNKGIGGTLTNAANGLVLTTVDIVPSGSNTYASGLPTVMGIDGGDKAKFDAGEAWTFEFNKQITLKQLVLTGMDFDGETVQVTVAGVDTNSFTRLDANMTNVSWEASANKYVYTYPVPITVPAGTDITIDAPSGQWGLQGVVVDVQYIDFGGNPSFYSNATYKAEMGGDTIVSWFGTDSAGRTNGIGNLASAGVGATLSAADYGVTMTTLAISSSDATRTNTVQSGGALGVNFAGSFAATFDAATATEWTFEFDKNVRLTKASFKDFAGTDEAEIIIGGVTNLIKPVDTVAATYETRSIYTFPASVAIAAGTDITIRAPVGTWGLRTLLIGLDTDSSTPVTPESLYADWVAIYSSGMSGQTNLTENPDGDALNNLYEYAQGGDPTTPDTGNHSVYSMVNVGGSNYLDYVHFELVDADVRGLVYEVQLDDDLVYAPGWTNIGYEVINGTVSDGLRSVTNRVPTDGKSQQFINLNIKLQ